MPWTRHRTTPIARFRRVLVLSTGSAARSPIAKSVLLWLSKGELDVQCAGVSPLDEIHPMARAAVRNVFNGRVLDECPTSIDACGDAPFDYVFTLSDEAGEHCPALAGNPARIHWALDDPAAAQGTRDHRQHAFDEVTRELVKRLRAWWLCQRVTAESAAALPSQPIRQPVTHAHWRTRPAGDAPLVAIAYSGPSRSCRNMCGLLERSGFQVLYDEKYARDSNSLPVLPDGVVVRVDGAPNGEIRPEFRAVQTLHANQPEVPILMLVDHVPSAGEQAVVHNSGANVLQRRSQRHDLIDSLWRLVHRLACLLLCYPIEIDTLTLFA